MAAQTQRTDGVLGQFLTDSGSYFVLVRDDRAYRLELYRRDPKDDLPLSEKQAREWISLMDYAGGRR